MLIVAFGLIIIISAGCSSHKGLVFANRDWHISDYYGQIIDKDTTYRMTFGNGLIPKEMTIVSSLDSLNKYPGMDRYIADILHTAHLDSAEILFYAPHMQTMFVKPKGEMPPMRPSSVSSPMNDENPFTSWYHPGDMEDWSREPSEMYTYTYYDKKKKQLLIVDCYDYGDTPIAQIFIFQTMTKAIEKMKIPNLSYYGFYYINDISKLDEHIEFWASHIDRHRKLAFDNYKIGQQPKIRKK